MAAGQAGAERELLISVVAVACLAVLSGGCGRLPEPGQKSEPEPVREEFAERPEHSATPSPQASPMPSSTPSPGAYWTGDSFAGTGYLLPLTIQYAGTSNAVLYFELEQPADGYLFYWHEGQSIEEAQQQPLASDGSVHKLLLEDLDPGSIYRMDVGLEGNDGRLRAPSWRGEPWGTVTLRTRDMDDTHIRVGVIGDSGFGEPVTYALGEQLAGSDLDFVIHTGDVVYRMDEEQDDPFLAYWLKYFLPFKPVLQQMPVYPVPGNHEYDAAAMWNNYPFYYHAFPSDPLINSPEEGIDGNRRWYALEYGSIQFLMMDSETVFGAPGRQEMRSWLEDRLQDDRFELTIPVAHIPLFSSGRYADESEIFQQLWHGLFSTSSVPLVLSGHDHNYQRIEVDGITYLVSGGGSTVLYGMQEPAEGHRFFQRVSHYVVLDIGPENIDIQAFSWEGELLDGTVIGRP